MPSDREHNSPTPEAPGLPDAVTANRVQPPYYNNGMSDVTEWVTAIGTAVTAGGVVLLWKQLDLLRKQVIADHERSRRENAINYVFEWSTGVLRGGSLARRLAENLDEQGTRDLVNERPLKFPADKKGHLLGVLSKVPEGGLQEKDGQILLGESEVSEIRWQLVRYLNILESIFAAARHNIADKEILIEQFGFLVSPREGHHLLKRFREALGTEGYPSLSELEKELEKLHETKASEKAAVDQAFRGS